MTEDTTTQIAVAAILGIPAGIHAVIAEVGVTAPDWIGSVTQISAFGLVAWIVFFMFTKWLPAIQAEHAVQLAEQRTSHALAAKTLADAHAAAIAKMSDSNAVTMEKLSLAFTENLKQQRADLLALRVCHNAQIITS